MTGAPPSAPSLVGPPPSPPQTFTGPTNLLFLVHCILFSPSPEGLSNFIRRPFPSTEPAVWFSLQARRQRHSTLPEPSARSVPAGVHAFGALLSLTQQPRDRWASPPRGFLLRPRPIFFFRGDLRISRLFPISRFKNLSRRSSWVWGAGLARPPARSALSTLSRDAPAPALPAHHAPRRSWLTPGTFEISRPWVPRTAALEGPKPPRQGRLLASPSFPGREIKTTWIPPGLLAQP